MTSQPLYMKPHPVCRATYTLYMWHQSHYSVSSLSLYWQHHTHSLWNQTQIIYGIVCTIQAFTYSLYDMKPPFYDITPTIFDIVSTVSVSSHPMYWWYHTNWIFEISSAIYDNIISIVYDITALHVCHHTHSFNDITPFVYRTSHPLYV